MNILFTLPLYYQRLKLLILETHDCNLSILQLRYPRICPKILLVKLGTYPALVVGKDPSPNVSSFHSWSSWAMDADAFQQDGWHQWNIQRFCIYFDYMFPTPLQGTWRNWRKKWVAAQKSKGTNFNWPSTQRNDPFIPEVFLPIQRITRQLS